MMLYAAATIAAILGQAAAFPARYNAKGICTIPDQGFAGHGAPTPNTDVMFQLTDASGGAVTEYTPGEVHIVTVPSYTTAPANMWIHTTGGTIEPSGASHMQASACEQAAYSLAPQASHEYMWTAPADGACVTVSAAMADSPSTAYQTNTVELCGAGAGAAGPAAGPGAAPAPPTATPTPSTPTTPAPTTGTPETGGSTPAPSSAFAATTGAAAVAAVAAVAALL